MWTLSSFVKFWSIMNMGWHKISTKLSRMRSSRRYFHFCARLLLYVCIRIRCVFRTHAPTAVSHRKNVKTHIPIFDNDRSKKKLSYKNTRINFRASFWISHITRVHFRLARDLVPVYAGIWPVNEPGQTGLELVSLSEAA